jgi:glycine betaine/proline transport system ATP-binding protein
MTETASAIEIRKLYKIFGPRPKAWIEPVKHGMTKAELAERHGHILGLNDISISMPAGRIQVIMGLSGSGKSTLIRHINRLIEPTSGSITIGGRDVLKMAPQELQEFRRSGTAMVFQRFALLPHRTVLGNVTFGLEVRGIDPGKSRGTGMRWIERVGLKGFENRYPAELSGGMQQRVGLARALSNDTSILLMDEAYSALDPLIRTDMQTMLLDLQKELKKTIVFITHDLDEALRLGDGIVILRDGSIIQQGNGQDILLRPADDYIERFIKDVNRGRYIRIESLIEPLPSGTGTGTGTDGLARIASGTPLEEAVKRLSDSGRAEAVVTDTTGNPVGRVGLRQMMGAL